MTGPEHYKKAEALLSEATRDPRDVSRQRSRRRPYVLPGADERERMITPAQVHATLALAVRRRWVPSNSGRVWQIVTCHTTLARSPDIDRRRDHPAAHHPGPRAPAKSG